jgi:hypothetical protein
MGPWIQAVKKQTREIVETLRHDHRDAEFEVGIVCYRDYEDKERFKIVEFSHNIYRVLNDIQDIQAQGGGDDAEDVAHGLIYTQMLPWDIAADVKMIFHIADAPAHGMKYHTAEVSDRFPGGDPQGLNIDYILHELATHGIDYTFIKITSATDKMIRRFAEVYEDKKGKFMVTDLTANNQQYRHMSDALSPTVIRSVTQRIASQDPKEDLYTPTQMPDSQDQG